MATRGTTRGVLSVLLICFLVSSGCLAGKNQKLSYENWHQMLEGEWMIKFFAPWCPACQRVASVWSSLASKAESLGIKVAEVDTTKEPALSGRFMVFSLPTIFHVKNGEFRKYEGQRSLQGFTDFITEEKWREVEPIPWWKSPSSFMMWCLGVTFKLSLFLKDLHELITVTYGLPDWASYTIFGLTTVLTGLFLGMVLVVVSDRIFASPSIPAPPPKKEDERQSGEECDNKDEQKETVETAQDINTEDSNSIRKRVLKSMNKATVNIGKDRENLSIVIDYVVVPLLIDLVNRENEELKRWLAEAIAI